jgi:hypothetical protein
MSASPCPCSCARSAGAASARARSRRFGASSLRTSAHAPTRKPTQTIAGGASAARSCHMKVTSTPWSVAGRRVRRGHSVATRPDCMFCPHLALYPARRRRGAAHPSQPQKHARVPQRVRLHPVQVKELRHAIVVGAKQLGVHFWRYRGAVDFGETVAGEEGHRESEHEYP